MGDMRTWEFDEGKGNLDDSGKLQWRDHVTIVIRRYQAWHVVRHILQQLEVNDGDAEIVIQLLGEIDEIDENEDRNATSYCAENGGHACILKCKAYVMFPLVAAFDCHCAAPFYWHPCTSPGGCDESPLVPVFQFGCNNRIDGEGYVVRMADNGDPNSCTREVE